MFNNNRAVLSLPGTGKHSQNAQYDERPSNFRCQLQKRAKLNGSCDKIVYRVQAKFLGNKSISPAWDRFYMDQRDAGQNRDEILRDPEPRVTGGSAEGERRAPPRLKDL